MPRNELSKPREIPTSETTAPTATAMPSTVRSERTGRRKTFLSTKVWNRMRVFPEGRAGALRL